MVVAAFFQYHHDIVFLYQRQSLFDLESSFLIEVLVLDLTLLLLILVPNFENYIHSNN